MKDRPRVVFDTNALVSRLLLPASITGRAVDKAVDEAQLLISEATLEDLADVLARAKFDSYITVGERQEFLRLLGRIAETVQIIHTIRACRDARDDIFLELAVNGEASLIITGDAELLELDPFQGIPIITPASYLGR